jgi:hypothetical protein
MPQDLEVIHVRSTTPGASCLNNGQVSSWRCERFLPAAGANSGSDLRAEAQLRSAAADNDLQILRKAVRPSYSLSLNNKFGMEAPADLIAWRIAMMPGGVRPILFNPLTRLLRVVPLTIEIGPPD